MFNKFFEGVLFFLLNICIINAVILKALLFTYAEKEHIYTSMVKDFNEYSKEKNLDIEINLISLTPLNTTINISNYSSMIKTLTNKKSKKYDIYFYYGSFTYEYGKHFEDLKKYSEITNNFEPETIKSICSYDNRIVGFPILIDIGSLYSNKILLSKYNKRPPKTWDELIETSKYILEEEKKIGNTDLIGYNGLIYDNEEGNQSIYEFIHSFRDNQNDPHPKIQSKNTEDALRKLKELKDEISSDIIFKKNDGFFFEKLFNGGAVFLKFWSINMDSIYQQTPIPGKIEGVSGTLGGGFNIAINRYIDDNRKEASIEVLKYLLSKPVQKKYVMKEHIYSAIINLYDDEEVCSEINCNMVKQSQPFQYVENLSIIYGYDDYSEKFSNCVFDYLYGNATLNETIKKAKRLTKYYSLELNSEDTSVGLIIFSIYIGIVLIILSSLVFLFKKEYTNQFKFLTKDCWLFIILGTIAILSSVLTEFYELTSMKCKIRVILIVFGFIFSFIPILYQLMVNFSSQNNKTIKFIQKSKYRILFAFFILNFILIVLILTSNYNIENVIQTNKESFRRCGRLSKNGRRIVYFSGIYGFVLILITFIFVFLEWNIEEIYHDLRFIVGALFMDILSIILYIFTGKIKCESYITYKLVLASNVFIYSLSNYIFLYAIRLFPSLVLINNEEERFLKSFLRKNKKYIESSLNTSFDCSDISSNINNKNYLNEVTIDNIDNKYMSDDRNESKADSQDRRSSSNNNHKRNRSKSDDYIHNIQRSSEINILLKYHYRVSKDNF